MILQNCCLLALFSFLINLGDALIISYMHVNLLKIDVFAFVYVYWSLTCFYVSTYFVFSFFVDYKVMGRAKKVGVSFPSSSNDMSKSTSSSKVSKACKLKNLGIFGRKKFIQDRGIDLNTCIGSYVHKIIMDRNWDTWLNMIGVINETLVKEFYHEFEASTIIENALLNLRGVVFRVNSRNLNDFLGLPDDIESDFLDVDVVENLDLMGKTLCADINFI